jgi:hypothetical protein
MQFRHAAQGLTLVLTLAAMPGQSALAETEAELAWKAVTVCAALSDEQSRHACVDSVLRAAGLLTAEREAKEQRDKFGLKDQAADRLEVQASRVTQTHDRKLIITTTDGAIWRQTEGGEILPLPKAGDPITIRKASLGSHVCQVRNTLAFRCTRSR